MSLPRWGFEFLAVWQRWAKEKGKKTSPPGFYVSGS
jgi:hypothetical protein